MSERDELVGRLRNPLGTGIAPTLWFSRAADQIERYWREIERLREALADLLTAYAACNGEDHPAYRRARAALNGEGER